MNNALRIGIVALGLVQGTAAPPVSEDTLLARLAIDLAADRDVTPISLDADGSGRHGVAYDRFSQAHLAARVAHLAGKPLTPTTLPSRFLSKSLIVIARPLVCGARTARPVRLDIDNRGRLVGQYTPLNAQGLRMWLAGATVPAGALAIMFDDTGLWSGEEVQIQYDGPVCSGTSNRAMLPVSTTPPRPLTRPTLDVPADRRPAGPVTVTLGGAIDLDGRLRYATMADAPRSIAAEIATAAAELQFEPARINGTPTPWLAGTILTFSVGGYAPTPSAEGCERSDRQRWRRPPESSTTSYLSCALRF